MLKQTQIGAGTHVLCVSFPPSWPLFYVSALFHNMSNHHVLSY